MRIFSYALVGLAALSFVSLTAEPADAMAVCTYGDVYNTYPSDPCEGLLCTGHGQYGGWQTCYPDVPPCTCPPPQSVLDSLPDHI